MLSTSSAGNSMSDSSCGSMTTSDIPSLSENLVWGITTGVINIYHDILLDKTKDWMPDRATAGITKATLSAPSIVADLTSAYVDARNDKSKYPFLVASVKTFFSQATAEYLIPTKAQLVIDGANFLGKRVQETANAFGEAARDINSNEGFVRALLKKDLQDYEFEARLMAALLKAPKQFEDLLLQASYCLFRDVVTGKGVKEQVAQDLETDKTSRDFIRGAVNFGGDGVKKVVGVVDSSSQEVAAVDLKLEDIIRNYWRTEIFGWRQKQNVSINAQAISSSIPGNANATSSISSADVTNVDPDSLNRDKQDIQAAKQLPNKTQNKMQSSAAVSSTSGQVSPTQYAEKKAQAVPTHAAPNSANVLPKEETNVTMNNRSSISLKPNSDQQCSFFMSEPPPLLPMHNNISLQPIVGAGTVGLIGIATLGKLIFSVGGTAAASGGASVMASLSVPLEVLSSIALPVLAVTTVAAFGIKIFLDKQDKRKIVDLSDEQRTTALIEIEKICSAKLSERDKKNVLNTLNEQYKLEQELAYDDGLLHSRWFLRGNAHNKKDTHTTELENCKTELSLALTNIVREKRKNLWQEGVELYNNSKPDEAIKKFTELLGSTGDVAMVRYYRAMSYAKSGNAERAIEDFDAASKFNEHRFDALSAAALMLLEKKDFQRAEQYLQQIESLNLKNDAESKQAKTLRLKYYTDIADSCLSGGKYSDANSFYEKALQIKVDDALAEKIRERQAECLKLGKLQLSQQEPPSANRGLSNVPSSDLSFGHSNVCHHPELGPDGQYLSMNVEKMRERMTAPSTDASSSTSSAAQKVEDVCSNVNSIRRNSQMNNDKSLAFISDNLWDFLEKFRASDAFSQCPDMRKLVNCEILDEQKAMKHDGGPALNPLVFDMQMVRTLVSGAKEHLKFDGKHRENQQKFIDMFKEFSKKTISSYQRHLFAIAQTDEKVAPGVTEIFAKAAQEVQKLQSDLSALTLDSSNFAAQIDTFVGKLEAVSLAKIAEQVQTRVAFVKEFRELVDFHLQDSMRLLPQYDYQLKKDAIEKEIEILGKEAKGLAQLNSTNEEDRIRAINIDQRIGELKAEAQRMEEEKALHRWEWHTRNFVNASEILGLTLGILTTWRFGEKSVIPALSIAYKVATVGAAASTILCNIIHRGAVAAASGPFAPFVAIAGALKTISDVVHGFMYGEEPSDRQVIVGAIQQVSKQIASIETTVIKGFNATFQLIAQVDERTQQLIVQVDKREQQRFNELDKKIVGGFSIVFNALRNISVDVGKLDAEVQNMNSSIDLLQENIRSLSAQVAEVLNNDYDLARRNARLACRSSDLLPDAKISKAVVAFCNRATTQASGQNLSGVADVKKDKDVDVSAADQILLASLQENLPAYKINLLLGYLNDVYGIYVVEKLVNPDVWAEAVNDLTDFIGLTPNFNFALYSTSLMEVHSVGGKFQNFIAGLKCSANFFPILIEDCRAGAIHVQTAIQGIILEHAKCKDFDALKKMVISKMPWHALFKAYEDFGIAQNAVVKQFEQAQVKYAGLANGEHTRMHEEGMRFNGLNAELAALEGNIKDSLGSSSAVVGIVRSMLTLSTFATFPCIDDTNAERKLCRDIYNKAREMLHTDAEHEKILAALDEHVLNARCAREHAQTLETAVQQTGQVFAPFAVQMNYEGAQKTEAEIYQDYLSSLTPDEYRNLLVTVKGNFAKKDSPLHKTFASFALYYRVLSAFAVFAFSSNQQLQNQLQKLWSANNNAEKILDAALVALGTAKQITNAEKNASLKIFAELLTLQNFTEEVSVCMRMIVHEVADAQSAAKRGAKVSTYFSLDRAMDQLERIFVLHDFRLGQRSSQISQQIVIPRIARHVVIDVKPSSADKPVNLPNLQDLFDKGKEKVRDSANTVCPNASLDTSSSSTNFSGAPNAIDDSDVHQHGWNCFDVAIGLKRSELVAYALQHSADLAFRRLLAPEIKHAAMIAVLSRTEQDRALAQKSEVTQKKIMELLQSADKYAGKDVNALMVLSQQINAFLDTEIGNEIKSRVRNTGLPMEMCNDGLCKIVNNYCNAHEDMKVGVATCNDLLNRGEGNRLSLEGLDTFFSSEKNREENKKAYDGFIAERNNKFLPSEQAFNTWAQSEDIYRQYINGYYSINNSERVGGWVAFQRGFSGEVSTSMVDIAALRLNRRIVIWQDRKPQDDKPIYRTIEPVNTQQPECHVYYNGHSHFYRPEPAQSMSSTNSSFAAHSFFSTSSSSSSSISSSSSSSSNSNLNLLSYQPQTSSSFR